VVPCPGVRLAQPPVAGAQRVVAPSGLA
jgi:hypothetical protein